MTIQQKGAPSGAEDHRPSNLFYLTRLRRPLVDRADGIYLWTKDGRRFIDGSSGAMVGRASTISSSEDVPKVPR